MIKSCLKTAWRNLTKDKAYSLLNILGLSTGMAVALLIGLWVAYQYSYDRSLPGYERAFQVKYNYNSKDGTIDTRDQIAIPLAEAMKNDVPGIEHVALAFKTDAYGPLSTILSVGEKKLGPKGIAVGADFLKIFHYPLVAGNADNAMNDLNSLVLTESTAKALFGTTNVIGRTVGHNNWNNHDLIVTGVLKDLPANSSLQFDFLTAFASDESTGWVKAAVTRWNEEVFGLYVSLKPNVTYAQVEPQISGLIKKYAPEVYRNRQQQVIMQPLKDWHLFSVYKNGIAEEGMIGYVRLFTLIGILVLVIACINFMNLSTARSEKRVREVGIRKVVGSTRGWLILQFLMESVMVAFAAFVLALFFVQLALPAFNALAGTIIRIPYASPLFWLLMLGYILLTGILAGSRPAFYLSSFKPLKVLKGKLQIGKSAVSFVGAASPRSFLARILRFPRLPGRQILVVLQFSASIAFVIGTIIIYQQIQYARSRPRGYDSDQLVVTEGVNGNYFALKQEALQSGVVSAMTVSFSPPTEVYERGDVETWPGKQTNTSVKVALNALGDTDFFKTLGISFVGGRNFSGEFANDSDCIILNEAAIRQMQLKQPVNQTIGWSYETLPPRLRVIGVVHDALTSSPYAAAEPTAYVFRPWLFTITYRLASNVNPHTAMDKLRTIFAKYRPDFPFQYHFVDDSFAAKFAMEALVGKLAGIFATLAIFISCLGLFGLAAYVAEQRTREIGIRKVLGASVKGVFVLVTKDFILLVVISCLIASPVAFYFLGRWLQGYYYHVSISPLVFVVADLGAIVLAITTISFQAIKASLMNPIKALRTE